MIRDVHKIILENLPEYTVYIFDENFRFVKALVSEKDIFLKRKAPLRGKKFSEVYAATEQKILRPLFKKVLEGEKFETEVVLHGKNFLARFSPFRDPDGIRYGIVYLKPSPGIRNDEEVQDERTVLFDGATVAMLFLDNEFRVLRANNAFKNTFKKYLDSELMGSDIKDLPLWKVSNIHNWQRIIDKLEPNESYRNIVNLHLSQGTFYYEIRLTSYNGGNRYLLYLKNVTELETLRTELTLTKLKLEQRELFLGKLKDTFNENAMMSINGQEEADMPDGHYITPHVREALQKLVAVFDER